MKLKTLTVKNFRCYKDEISIHFDSLTTIVGTNDIGKSSLLEALEIFFNNQTVKIEPADASIGGVNEIIIQCDFIDLPKEVVLDSGEKTNLAEEYLVLSNDLLRIRKVYDCSKKSISPQIFIIANHPTEDGYTNLLKSKEKELQKMVKDKGLDCGFKGNPIMRKAIWNSCPDLKLAETAIDVTKSTGDDKSIWLGIEKELPTFALFQSDRQSQDSDDEVQNPMKVAIKEAMAEVDDELQSIIEKVKKKSMQFAEWTTEAIKEISPSLGSELTPYFAHPTDSKLNGLFSISMNTDLGIPLNKRGSGVRRLILIGFFKAAAEKMIDNKRNIIYAVEEPETAQHPNNQKILIESFINLAKSDKRQVILTTHSPGIAKELPIDSLRFVTRDGHNRPEILSNSEHVIDKVIVALGIPLGQINDIKAIVCVEGPTDVIAMNSFCRCLRSKYHNLVDLNTDSRLMVIPLGGSILKHWVDYQYLRRSNVPEIHIYDNDVNQYQESIDAINSRTDGSWGTLTSKYEIENYLHTDAIKDAYGFGIDTDKKDVPRLFGIEYSKMKGLDNPMGANKSKTYLSRVFEDTMTCDRLEERDTIGEVYSWMERITNLVNR